jgi:NDP-sugar pyrophosphorylase family protein
MGTRLRPLTLQYAQIVVPVLNRPFLEYVLCRLKGHGIGEIILAISHLASPIEACFGDGSRMGIKSVICRKIRPWGRPGYKKLRLE